MIGILLLAQLAQPVPRLGTCPLGYYSQGSYCMPSQWGDRQAIEKLGGSCPLGWFTQGDYCVRDEL